MKLSKHLIRLILIIASCQGDNVLQFQMDGKFSEETFLRANVNLSGPIHNYTCCVWFWVQHDRGTNRNSLVSVSDLVTKQDNVLYIAFAFDKEKLDAKVKITVGLISFLVELDAFDFQSWFHVCVVIVDVSGDRHLNVFVNGHAKLSEQDLLKTHQRMPLKENVVILGQDQDSPGSRFEYDQAFSGKLSGFNLWDRSLMPEEILYLSHCSLKSPGNILSFSQLKDFHIENVTLIESEMTPCEEVKEKYALVTEPMGWDGSFAVCKLLGGELPILDKDSTYQRNDTDGEYQYFKGVFMNKFKLGKWMDDPKCIYTEAYTKEIYSISIRMGQKRNEKGVWINPYTNEALTFYKPTHEYYNGLNCATLVLQEIRQNHCEKSIRPCTLCRLKPDTKFSLKGLSLPTTSKLQHFDTKFYLDDYLKNGRLHWLGITLSHIFFNDFLGRWVLQSFVDPSMEMHLTVKSGELPFGRRLWKYHDSGIETKLTFSTCKDDEFTCEDGDCIHITQRCNRYTNCADTSDEWNCSTIIFPPSYVKEMIPVQEDYLPIQVKLNIHFIPSVNTAQLKFASHTTIRLVWDDFRLKFQNLRSDSKLNRLSTDEMTKIWSPVLIFANSLGVEQFQVDTSTNGIVSRHTEGSIQILDNAQEGYSYPGESNYIHLSREFFNEYLCHLQLDNYPFDYQVCLQVYTLPYNIAPFVKFVKGDLPILYSGQRGLTEFDILDEVLQITENGTKVEAKIIFQRRIEYHLSNTFLQMSILLLIGYLSFFFDLEDFTNRIMVTLTTMLVVATLTASIQTDLPKTAYFKIIDVWFMFILHVLVLIFFCHTLIGAVDENVANCIHPLSSWTQKPGMKARLNWMAKIGVFTLIVLFNVCFWSFALNAHFTVPQIE